MKRVLCISGLILVLGSACNQEPKILVVDRNKIFEDFKLVREMRKSTQRDFEIQKYKTDSLYKQVALHQGDSAVMLRFIESRERLDRMANSFPSEKITQIHSRLESYANDFAAEKNCDLILFKEDMGQVLHAAKPIDVTQEFVEYANKKYEGLP